MVGFTRLGEAVPPEDLVRLVERLGDLAREIVNPPVRSVKTIGDALMLICPDLVKFGRRDVGTVGGHRPR